LLGFLLLIILLKKHDYFLYNRIQFFTTKFFTFFPRRIPQENVNN